MTAEEIGEAEGMTLSFGNLMTLMFTLACGAALGAFLSVFLAPGSDLALLIGISIFPAVLLGGGLLVEELWFLRLWQYPPHHWGLTITNSTAGPGTQAEREHSAVFLPLGSAVGAIGALPRLGHGMPTSMQSEPDPKKTRYSRSRLTSGRPKF